MPIERLIWIEDHVPLFVWTSTTETASISQPNYAALNPRQREQKEGSDLLAYACLQLGLPFDQISKDPYGKPQLLQSPWEFSITHSSGFLAAVFHPTLPVGIDLERPQSRIGRIIARLCSEKELAWAGQDVVKQCFLWSAKEAMYKLYGKREVDFRKNLVVHSETYGEIHMPNFHATVRLIPYWEAIPDHLIVVALPTSIQTKVRVD